MGFGCFSVKKTNKKNICRCALKLIVQNKSWIEKVSRDCASLQVISELCCSIRKLTTLHLRMYWVMWADCGAFH